LRQWISLQKKFELLPTHAISFASAVQPLEKQFANFMSKIPDALAVVRHAIINKL
jgi:hypothetical protein